MDAGFGTAFYMFFAHRSGSLEAQAVVLRRADWGFTTPAVLVQPAAACIWCTVPAGRSTRLGWRFR